MRWFRREKHKAFVQSESNCYGCGGPMLLNLNGSDNAMPAYLCINSAIGPISCYESKKGAISKTPGCRGCGYAGHAILGVIDACSNCIVWRDEFKQYLPELFWPKKDKEMVHPCQKCRTKVASEFGILDYNLVYLCKSCKHNNIIDYGGGRWEWKFKEHKEMKCKTCDKDIEVDVRLEYCASCVHDKLKVEIGMKVFDLRPFEVKKPSYKSYSIALTGAITGNHMISRDGTYDFIIECLTNELSGLGNFQAFDVRVCEVIEKEWTFEDIKVGWFFKTLNAATNEIRLKINDEEYIQYLLYHTDKRQVISNKSYIPADITNVYDCPELTKLLMIERIVT